VEDLVQRVYVLLRGEMREARAPSRTEAWMNSTWSSEVPECSKHANFFASVSKLVLKRWVAGKQGLRDAGFERSVGRLYCTREAELPKPRMADSELSAVRRVARRNG
jgi:hypothetical protein